MKGLHVKISEWVVIVTFTLVIITTVAQVIFRYLINFSLPWADELARYCFVWLVYSGILISLIRGEHAVVSVVTDLCKGKTTKVLATCVDLLVLALFVVLIFGGIKVMNMSVGQTTSGLGIPKLLVYCALPFGGILMLVELISRLYKRFTGRIEELK